MKLIYSLNHYYTTSINTKFKCQSCGSCCLGWEINIDENTYQKLSNYFKEHPLPYSSDQPLFIVSEDSKKVKNSLINGRCIFLEEDNLCYIHRNLGKQAKSEVCLTYPNICVPTSRGIFNTLSFSCPAAARLLDHQEPFSFELLQHGSTIKPDKELNFHGEEKIPWNLYFLIEEYLMNLIEKEAYPFEEKIVLGNFLLWGIYNEFIKLNHKEYKPLKERLEELKKEGYQTLARSLKNLPSSVHIQLKFLITLLKKRLEMSKNEFFAYNKLIDITNLISKNFDLEEDLSKFNSRQAIKYSRNYRNDYLPHLNEINHIFKNFFLYKIFGKEIVIKHGIIKGYQIVLILYALMRFYCMTLWADKFCDDDVFKAISFIERYYSHSPGILDFWKTADKTGLMSEPLFAHILIQI
ncbi:MAG: flagellin lysine-N-methylase [bacterium]